MRIGAYRANPLTGIDGGLKERTQVPNAADRAYYLGAFGRGVE